MRGSVYYSGEAFEQEDAGRKENNIGGGEGFQKM